MLFRDLPQFNQFDRTGLMRQGKMRLSAAPQSGFCRIHHYAVSLTAMWC